LAEIATRPNSFPVDLSLQHKVFKLKGGVRNVSMQLQMKQHILRLMTGTLTIHPTLIPSGIPFQETCCSAKIIIDEQQGAYIVFDLYRRHT
jgi:hypothetical protein